MPEQRPTQQVRIVHLPGPVFRALAMVTWHQRTR